MQQTGSGSGNSYAGWLTNVDSPTAAPEKGVGPVKSTDIGTTPATTTAAPSAAAPSTAPPVSGQSTAAAPTTPIATKAIPVAIIPDTKDPVERERLPAAPSVAPSGGVEDELEEDEEGDVLEGLIRKLKGTRPDLLRTSTYYEGAKHVYGTLAGLPVLGSLAPTVESVAETLINMTPLKPNGEEQDGEKSVAILDKKIRDALSYADGVVDAKKDETIEGIVSVKKVVHELGPVQSAVGVVCHVGDGVGKAYGSATEKVGGIWDETRFTVSNTFTGATSLAGEAINTVSETAGSAVGRVTIATVNVVESVPGAGRAFGGIMGVVESVKHSIGATFSWATSTMMSVISAVVGFPMHVLQSVIGTNRDANPVEH